LAVRGPPSEQTQDEMERVNKEEFDLELYKEFKSEEQFFRHYLDLGSRRRTEAINRGLQYF
jgi:hypothetical protein